MNSSNYLRVTLTGPCSPMDVAELLNLEYRNLAKNLVGYRGVPVSLLAKALVSEGHSVTVVTTTPDIHSDCVIFHGENFNLVMVPRRHRARSRALDFFRAERHALAREIARSRPDIVHAHWTYEFALAALKTGLPTLVTAHDAPVTIVKHLRDSYRLLRFLMALRLRLTSKFMTAVSPYLVDRWRKEMFWRGRMKVIPNITPYPTKSCLEISSSPKPNVISIGGADRRKNIENLVLAWPLVKEKNPAARLWLIGDGLDCESPLAQYYTKYEEFDGITWFGYTERDQLLELLKSSDILVHPSLEEAQPMVLLEGMSQGLPIVGGIQSGGVPYTIGDAGLLVDVTKPGEIAQAINSLLADPELRHQLGQLGIQRVSTEFSAKEVSRKYLEEYHYVIANW